MKTKTRAQNLPQQGLVVFIILLVGTIAFSQEKNSSKYLKLLLDRPEPGLLFDRFIDASIKEGTSRELEIFLTDNQKKAPAYSVLLGHWYLRQDQPKAAFDTFAQISSDQVGGIDYWKAIALYENKQFDQAVKMLDLASTDAALPVTRREEIPRLKGQWLLDLGNPDEALEVWNATLTPDAPDERFWDVLSLQMNEGLFEAATTTARQLISRTKDPYQKTSAFLDLGEAQIALGLLENALESFAAALALSGSDSWIETEIVSRVNSLFRNQDNLTGLQDLLKKWITTHPNRVNLRRSLAHTLADLQKTDEAIDVYKETVRLSPGNREARERYAAFLEQIGKLSESIQVYEQLIKTSPDDATLYLRLAALAYATRDREKTKLAISDFVTHSDESNSAFASAARLLENYREFARAEEVHRERIRRFPDKLGARENLAAFLHRQNREGEAIATWRKVADEIKGIEALRIVRALRSHGENEAAWALLLGRRDSWKNESAFLNEFCRMSLVVDHPEIAIPEAQQLVFMANSTGSLKTALEVVTPLLNRSGKMEVLLAELEQAPHPGVPHIALIALLLDQTNRTELAIQRLSALPRQDQPLAIEVRIQILESRKMWQLAIDAVKEALNLPNGRRSDNIIRLVEFSDRAGQSEEVLKWIEEWKKIAPGSVSPWLRQARVFQETGRTGEAVTLLETASRRFADDPVIKENLAKLYLAQGLAPEAEKIFLKLYESSQETGDKLRWAAHYTDVSTRLGRQKKAIRLFEKRHRQAPQSDAPILALVELYQKSESLGLAKTWLQKLLRNRPENVIALLRLASIDERLGNITEAKNTLEKARKFDNTGRSTHRLARLLISQGDETAALRLLFETAALDITDPNELVKVVTQLAGKQKWQQVLDLTNQVLEQHPADYRVNYIKGVALEELGLSARAVEQFIHAINTGAPQLRQLSPTRQGHLPIHGNLPPGFEEFQDFRAIHHRAYSTTHNRKEMPLPASAYEAELLSFAHLQNLFPELEDVLRKDYRKQIARGRPRIDWWLRYGEIYDSGSIYDAIPESLHRDPAALLDQLLHGVSSDLESLQKAVQLLESDYPDAALLAIRLARQLDSKEARLFVGTTLGRLLSKTTEPSDAALRNIVEISSSIYFDWNGAIAEAHPEVTKLFEERTEQWIESLSINAPFRPQLVAARSAVLQNAGEWDLLATLLASEAERFGKSGKIASSKTTQLFDGQGIRYSHPWDPSEIISFPPNALPHYPDWLLWRKPMGGEIMWFEGFTENASKIFQSLPEEKISIAEDRVLSVFLTSRAGHDPLEIIEAIENDPQATVDELITAASYHSSHSFAQKSLQLLDRAIPLVSDPDWKNRLTGFRIGIMAAHLTENPDWQSSLARSVRQLSPQLTDYAQLQSLARLCSKLHLKAEAAQINHRLGKSWTGKTPSNSFTNALSAAPQKSRIARMIEHDNRSGATRFAKSKLSRLLQDNGGLFFQVEMEELIREINRHDLAPSIIALRPDDDLDGPAWNIHARIAYRLNRNESAKSACRTAIEKSPSLPHGYGLLSSILAQEANHKGAAEVLIRSGRLIPAVITEMEKFQGNQPSLSIHHRGVIPIRGQVSTSLLLTIQEYLKLSTVENTDQPSRLDWIPALVVKAAPQNSSQHNFTPRPELVQLAKQMADFPPLEQTGFYLLSIFEKEGEQRLAAEAEQTLRNSLLHRSAPLPLPVKSAISAEPVDYWMESLFRDEGLTTSEVNKKLNSLFTAASIPEQGASLRETSKIWMSSEADLLHLVQAQPDIFLKRACRVARARNFSFAMSEQNLKTLVTKVSENLDKLEPLAQYAGHLARSPAGIAEAVKVINMTGNHLAELDAASGEKQSLLPANHTGQYVWIENCHRDPALFPSVAAYVQANRKTDPSLNRIPLSQYRDILVANPHQVRDLIRYSDLFNPNAEAASVTMESGRSSPSPSQTAFKPLLFSFTNMIRNATQSDRAIADQELQQKKPNILLTLVDVELSMLDQMAQQTVVESIRKNIAYLKQLPLKEQENYTNLFSWYFRNGKPVPIPQSDWDELLSDFDFQSRKHLPFPEWTQQIREAKTIADLEAIPSWNHSHFGLTINGLIQRSPRATAEIVANYAKVRATGKPGTITTLPDTDLLWQQISQHSFRNAPTPEATAFLTLILASPEIGKDTALKESQVWHFGDWFKKAMSTRQTEKKSTSESPAEHFAHTYRQFAKGFGDGDPTLAASFFHMLYHSIPWRDWPDIETFLKNDTQNPGLANSLRIGLLHHHEAHRWDRGEAPDGRRLTESFQWFLDQLKDERLPLRTRLLLSREACLDDHEHLVPKEVVYAGAAVLEQAIADDFAIDGTTYTEITRHLARVEKSPEWNPLASRLIDNWFLLQKPGRKSPLKVNNESGLAMLELILAKKDKSILNRFLLNHYGLLEKEPATIYLLARGGEAELAGGFILQQWARLDYDYGLVTHDGSPFTNETLAAFRKGTDSDELAFLGEIILQCVPEKQVPQPDLSGFLQPAQPNRGQRLRPLIDRFSKITFHTPQVRSEALRRIVYRDYKTPVELLPFLNGELQKKPVHPLALLKTGGTSKARFEMIFPYAYIGASARNGDVDPFGLYLSEINRGKKGSTRRWLHWEIFEHFSNNIIYSWPQEPERISREMIPILWEYLSSDDIYNKVSNSYALACLMTAHLITDSMADFQIWWDDLSVKQREHLIACSKAHRRTYVGLWAALKREDGVEDKIDLAGRIQIIKGIMATKQYREIYEHAPKWYRELVERKVLTPQEIIDHFDELDNGQKRDGWAIAERAVLLSQINQLDDALALIQSERSLLFESNAGQETTTKQLARLSIGEARAYLAAGEYDKASQVLAGKFPQSIMATVREVQRKITMSR